MNDGKSKVSSSKVVMLGDTPLTPEVCLFQLQEEVSDIEAIVSIVFYKKPNGGKYIDIQWTDMKVHDLACASVVLDMRMREVMDDSTGD